MSEYDAVVIIPGIMGSELALTDTGQCIWGFRNLSWYVRGWSSGRGMGALELTDAELAGDYGRVTPVGLLRFPAFARAFAGFEPYRRLVKAAQRTVIHPAAVLEFAYDWRLPVTHNAKLLAAAIDRHLEAWLTHPAYLAAQQEHPSRPPATIILVAHSMGGLLAHALPPDERIRHTVTLGTPFFGSVKALTLLNSGQGTLVPLPGIQRLVSRLPGLHDLLPVYRCVDRGDQVDRLTPGDIARLGGDRELAEASQLMHAETTAVSLSGHRALIGVGQPTPTSVSMRCGVVKALPYECRQYDTGIIREERAGDGTVYRDAATTPGASLNYLPQQHGALARTDEAIALIRAVITERDPESFGPPLGAVELGIEVPDVVLPGVQWAVRILGMDNPAAARCTLHEVGSGRLLNQIPIVRRGGHLIAEMRLPTPGIFRIEVSGASSSPVTQMVMATDPGAACE